MSATNYPDTMSTLDAPTSPAQESPTRWWRFRSVLGLGIAWLVLLGLGIAWPLYLTVEIVLGGRAFRVGDGVIGAASGATVYLILTGLRALWRRRREAEAADHGTAV